MSRNKQFRSEIIYGAVDDANVEVAVAHNLGGTPVDAFVIGLDRSAIVYRGTTAWDTEFVYVRASVARTGFTLYLFGPGQRITGDVVAERTRAFNMIVFPDPTSTVAAGVSLWPDAVDRTAYLVTVIPPDYSSGDIEIHVVRRGAATNTAVMRYTIVRFRDATAVSTIETNTAANFTPGDTNSHELTITIAAAGFQAGDTIRVAFERLGTDGSDNMAATVNCDGAWIEYTSTA